MVENKDRGTEEKRRRKREEQRYKSGNEEWVLKLIVAIAR